jgi:uncharacterized protein (TIGR00266 family)
MNGPFMRYGTHFGDQNIFNFYFVNAFNCATMKIGGVIIMKYSLTQNVMFPMVTVDIGPNDMIRIARGAMVYHDGDTQLDTHLNAQGSGLGKLVKSVGRSMVSGESMFITEVKSGANGGRVALAANMPGEIMELNIGEENFRLNDGVFLAMDDEVNYKMVRQSLGKAVFAGSGGLFVMETTGSGMMLVNTFGSIVKMELDGSAPLTVDNQHVVAWSSSLDYEIHFDGNKMFNSIGTGEGVVNTFNGTGTVYIQTLNLETFANQLQKYIATSSKS